MVGHLGPAPLGMQSLSWGAGSQGWGSGADKTGTLTSVRRKVTLHVWKAGLLSLGESNLLVLSGDETPWSLGEIFLHSLRGHARVTSCVCPGAQEPYHRHNC